MKRCMHLVSSKSSNSDILAFLLLECNELICIILRRTDEHTIKHMKINQKVEKNNTLYYLSSRRLFKSIIELVSFYERNDLGENFAGFVSPHLNFSKKHDFFQFNYSIVYFSTCTPFRLNQSLSWPFREVVATALYDFTPREPNQLPLRQGCQVLVIGKEGDSKGWWRGKTMERVSVNCTNSWCAPLPNCKLIEFWILFSRLDSFQKSTSVSIRRLQRSYDVTITWYFFPWHGNHHNRVIQITTQATNTIQKHRLSPGSVQCRLAHQHDRFHRLHRLLVAHRVVKNRARVLQNEWIYVYLSNCKADGSFSMEKCRWNEWETREKKERFSNWFALLLRWQCTFQNKLGFLR